MNMLAIDPTTREIERTTVELARDAARAGRFADALELAREIEIPELRVALVAALEQLEREASELAVRRARRDSASRGPVCARRDRRLVGEARSLAARGKVVEAHIKARAISHRDLRASTLAYLGG